MKSFEAANYDAAAEKFEEAMRLAPNDMILPFAYAQALFADGQYTKSAELLREALSKASPEKEGVFYPRGLYANDDVLYAQIEDLVEKLENYGYDADMQLLLGYHLLGMGETGYAREPLERAGQDLENAEPAAVLLKLLDKIESEAGAADKADGAESEAPDAATRSDAQPSATETTTGGVLRRAPRYFLRRPFRRRSRRARRLLRSRTIRLLRARPAPELSCRHRPRTTATTVRLRFRRGGRIPPTRVPVRPAMPVLRRPLRSPT